MKVSILKCYRSIILSDGVLVNLKKQWRDIVIFCLQFDDSLLMFVLTLKIEINIYYKTYSKDYTQVSNYK